MGGGGRERQKEGEVQLPQVSVQWHSGRPRWQRGSQVRPLKGCWRSLIILFIPWNSSLSKILHITLIFSSWCQLVYMCHCRIPLHYSKIHGTLLYAGKYLPTFYFRPCCRRANLRLGEFQCLKLFNKTIFRRIQNGNCL